MAPPVTERAADTSSRQKPQPYCQELFQIPLPATMAGEGELYRILRVFLRLQRICTQAKVSFSCDRDCDGDINVSLTVKSPRDGDKAPRRRGHHSRSQGVREAAQALGRPPPPDTPVTPATPTPAPAPAPEKRRRRRGPAATFRNEQRRLGRIQPGILAPTIEVKGGPALPPPPSPWHTGRG